MRIITDYKSVQFAIAIYDILCFVLLKIEFFEGNIDMNKMYTVKRKIKKYTNDEAEFEVISRFYSDVKNRRSICIIYRGREIETLISYDDICNMKNKNQYDFYKFNSNNHHVVYKDSEAESLFKIYKEWTYLIKRIDKDVGVFYSRNQNSTSEIINEIYLTLKRNNVNVYRVNIPNKEDIIQNNRADLKCSTYLSYYVNLIINKDMEAPWYIGKITDVDASKIGICQPVLGKTLGDGTRTLYLVGPCIVGGFDNQEGEKLAQIISNKLSQKSKKWKVSSIPLLDGDLQDKKEILKNTIKKNDVVLLINRNLEDFEYDMTEAYNTYSGNNYMYTNIPIHTTVTGNKIISDRLIKDIIIPLNNNMNILDDNEIAYDGSPQFTSELEDDVKRYVKRIELVKKINKEKNIIGAVVMNCNPFSYGHRYLIEYAASKVDYLYVFVVEEDLSAIPFIDRIFLVHEGIKDLSNVICVPSGKFIISRDTFYNYFEKEHDVHTAHAEEDVHIFGRYIASGLHITKRFVGQEPYDEVTNSYNKAMKKILPTYGVEVIEIPRLSLNSETKAINATDVRRLLEKNEKKRISKYVPDFVKRYLCMNRDTILQRIDVYKSEYGRNYLQYTTQMFIKKISSYEKIVIYSIGRDTQVIIKLLPDEIKNKVEYSDKIAIGKDIFFNGKKVYAPKELNKQLNDYKIIIGSTQFGKDIYEEFINMGIDINRCIFNQISFHELELNRRLSK